MCDSTAAQGRSAGLLPSAGNNTESDCEEARKSNRTGKSEASLTKSVAEGDAGRRPATASLKPGGSASSDGADWVATSWVVDSAKGGRVAVARLWPAGVARPSSRSRPNRAHRPQERVWLLPVLIV